MTLGATEDVGVGRGCPPSPDLTFEALNLEEGTEGMKKFSRISPVSETLAPSDILADTHDIQSAASAKEVRSSIHLRRSPTVTSLENCKASQQPTKPTLIMSTAELASSYAALILADDGIEITVCPFPPLYQS